MSRSCARSAGRRTPALVAVLLVSLLGAAQVLGVATAPRAAAEESALPPTVTTLGDDEQRLDLPIPPGIAPTSLRARLSTDSGIGGEVVVVAGEREVARVEPGPAQDIAFPLLFGDVDEQGVLGLRVRYEVPATGSGCPSLEPVTTVLEDLVLTYTGEEDAATSMDDFFPALATRIDVQVPRSADDDMLTAGLSAVAALGAVYPEGTPIVLGSPGTVLPRTGIGQRVVKLEPSPDGEPSVTVTEKYGLQTLVVSGEGEALVDAARAFGSSLGDLAGAEGTGGLEALPGVRDPDAQVSLAELGMEEVALSGVGLGSASVTVPQDALGGPVERLDLRVVGTHTAVDAGSKAQLNTYVNDVLVDSQLLGGESTLEIEASVSAGRLRPVNDVRFSLAALPVDGVCPTPGTDLPLEVSLDPAASTVTGVPGTGTTAGFALFPQVLGGVLPVGVRGRSRARVAATAHAAELVLALQRASAAPLQVEVLEAASLIAGDRGGLLVGAGESDAVALQAPVPLSAFRQVDTDGRTFGVGSDDPFAALQASGPPERPVLVLGSWAPGGRSDTRADTRSLVGSVVEQAAAEGWSALEGNVLVAHGDGRTFALDVAPARPPLDDEESEPPAAWWVLPGIGLLALLLALQVVSHVRRDRSRVDRSQDRPDGAGPAGLDQGSDQRRVSGGRRP